MPMRSSAKSAAKPKRPSKTCRCYKKSSFKPIFVRLFEAQEDLDFSLNPSNPESQNELSAKINYPYFLTWKKTPFHKTKEIHQFIGPSSLFKKNKFLRFLSRTSNSGLPNLATATRNYQHMNKKRTQSPINKTFNNHVSESTYQIKNEKSKNALQLHTQPENTKSSDAQSQMQIENFQN